MGLIANSLRDLAKLNAINLSDYEESDKSLLILFSGGMDSTALVCEALNYTSFNVHLHHVELVQDRLRHRAEKESVRKIVSFCRKNYRDFSYTESVVQEPTIGKHNPDNDVWAFAASRISAQKYMDYIVFGTINRLHLELWRVKIRFLLTGFFITENASVVPPVALYPADWEGFRGVSDSEIDRVIYDSIPDQLTKTISSCRSPVDVNGDLLGCGECYACKRLEGLRR